MSGKCEHGLTTKECLVCVSPKHGAHDPPSSQVDALIIRQQLQIMLGSAVAVVDADDVVVGYRIKTGAIHRLVGILALTVPANMPSQPVDLEKEIERLGDALLEARQAAEPKEYKAASALQAPQPDEVHSCSYWCERPSCIKAQRDEMRERLEALQPEPGQGKRVCSNCGGSGVVGIPGAPCPFCKLESLAWQWEPSPDEALAEYDAALSAPPQGADYHEAHLVPVSIPDGRVVKMRRCDLRPDDRVTFCDFANLRPAALAAPPQGASRLPPEVTDEMVAAYLKANDAYWKEQDSFPVKNQSTWRNGTAKEATLVSLRAALSASPLPAPQEPAAESVARWLEDHDLIEEAAKARAIYAAPAPSSQGESEQVQGEAK